ncbi:unnamed protein product, partial [Schistosoma margrebowiei]|uniref:SWIM-type domain-containing protein n=1 Tax=Schistosoma margrebowiei TaxID=48269 RepID=A0AA85APR9_9TREM
MLNKRFGSWIEFDNALKDFHKITHTHYVHAEMFRCTFGRKRKSEGLNVNKKPSKFLNCQSMFRVRLEGQQYVIKSYNMSHNHPCTSSWMVCDPFSRRLSAEEKENLKPVILHCQSTDEVIESIKERTGKQVTAADVKNLKAELSTGWTRKQVLQIMRQNGEVREHAENGCITAICFSSYDQIRLYNQYPEVVCIDSTYKTNNKKYSLFQLVVTDNCGRGRTVMFAWTQKEKRADVTWILDKFKEIMGDTTKTETFVMDCARSESAAVRITHGHANIILCAFHVIRAFRKKTTDKILKTYLTRLVTAETVGRFNQYYRIINRRDRVIGQYLSRYWMPRKAMWARAFYGSVLTLGNNTNNRVESLNRQIKRYVRKSDSLHKCMYKAFKWSSMTFSRKSIEDEIVSRRTYSYDAPQRLIPLLNMLTPFARCKVLYELKKMRFVNCEYESGEWLFMADRGQHYEVDLSICQCNCSTFNMCRYPCRHLLLAYVKRRNLT